MERNNVPLRVAVREALCLGGDAILGEPQRFVANVMDVTDPEDSTIVVFTNNCDAELLVPLSGLLRERTTEVAAMTALRIEALLAESRMVQQRQAQRVACELVFGTCAYAGVVPPEEVIEIAVGKVPAKRDRIAQEPPEAGHQIPGQSALSFQDQGEGQSYAPPQRQVPPRLQGARDPVVAHSVPEPPKKKPRRSSVPFIAVGVALLLVIALVGGAFTWKGHVQSAAIGNWVVSEVQYGQATDSGFWSKYYTYSRGLTLDEDGTCKYAEQPVVWEGTWAAGLPLVESALTVDLTEGETMTLEFEDEHLVLEDDAFTITFDKDDDEGSEDSEAFDTGQIVGLWQVCTTKKQDGTTIDEQQWDAARASGKNVTLRISDDRTLEWCYSNKWVDGTWKMVDDRCAVFVTDEGGFGLISVSDDNILRFAFADDDYTEYRRV